MNTSIVNILSKVEKIKYLKLLDESEFSTNFHSLKFLQIIENIRPDLKLKFNIIYENSEIVAIMPFFQKKYFPLSLSSLPYGCYGGFLYKNKSKEKVVAFLKNYKYRLFTVIASYNDDIYEGESLNGIEYSTWIIKCNNSYNDFFTALHHKTRNQIRKAYKNGIVVKDIKTEEELNIVYDIYEDLILKHKIKKPYPKKLFIELFDASLNSDEIFFKLAVLEGKVTAYSIFLNNKRTIFYWLNASDPELNKFNGTNAILDTIVKYAYSNKIIEINLGAVPYGNDGLHHFKSRWKAEEFKYKSFFSKIYKMKRKVIEIFSK